MIVLITRIATRGGRETRGKNQNGIVPIEVSELQLSKSTS